MGPKCPYVLPANLLSLGPKGLNRLYRLKFWPDQKLYVITNPISMASKKVVLQYSYFVYK